MATHYQHFKIKFTWSFNMQHPLINYERHTTCVLRLTKNIKRDIIVIYKDYTYSFVENSYIHFYLTNVPK